MSVSNAGKKRGRARQAGKGITKNLNMGQFIGEGRKHIIMPGLNYKVQESGKIVQPARGQDNPVWYGIHGASTVYFMYSSLHSFFQGKRVERNSR